MKKYRFTGRIEAVDRGGACLLFPFDVQKEFGTNGRVAVEATFDGIPYKGSLVKYGQPQHMLPMLKAIREQLGKQPGDSVAVELWRDNAERTVDVPKDLEQALERSGTRGVFDKLSYTHRKEYCRWVTDAKREETRQRRVNSAIELLQQGIRTPDGAKR